MKTVFHYAKSSRFRLRHKLIISVGTVDICPEHQQTLDLPLPETQIKKSVLNSLSTLLGTFVQLLSEINI